MYLEVHILQNFAPSNLNRDDTGAPKDCEFGGYRRARISSQCLKRAIRTSFETDGLLQPEQLAVRTKRLIDELVDGFVAAGRSAEEARQVAEAGLVSMGLELKGEKTQYLIFLGRDEVKGLVDVCLEHWNTLRQAVPAEGKKPKKGVVSDELKIVGTALKKVLNGGKAADLALFGRMLADLPEHNVDAASQVAHALSTNKVSPEFDFYTAVDDLKPEDTAGADMLGTIEFNSACFYRYANVDIGQLVRNLNGDVELARVTVEAFLRAAATAVPTGKQNSMAAHNPPSLILAVVREYGLQNLANAFTKPAVPNREGDLIENSVRKLADFRTKLTGIYGDAGVRGAWVATTEPEAAGDLQAEVATLDGLVQGVLGAVEVGKE